MFKSTTARPGIRAHAKHCNRTLVPCQNDGTCPWSTCVKLEPPLGTLLEHGGQEAPELRRDGRVRGKLERLVSDPVP
jgi:hypothetical protein